jgi:hypothetical protein
MLWRHLCLVRALSAAGLLACSMLGTSARAGSETEPAAAPPEVVTETVPVLEGQKSGDLFVEVRGDGQDKVRFRLKNQSAKRLNVVIPPGLVASSTVGQGAAGGAGGFQSMGLGSVSNRPGAFGQFRVAANESGLRSIDVADPDRSGVVTVPAGKEIEFHIPAVCLNYGLTTPAPRHKFRLVDVNDYSRDPRVRKALRSLATIGTSQGVAQAVMWNVCNNLSFEQMMAQAGGKVLNVYEVSMAARIVEAIDASGTSELIDPAYLTHGRVFVRLQGEGALAKDADRLGIDLDGKYLLGLPVGLVGRDEMPEAMGPALFLNIGLAAGANGETRGRISVSHLPAGGAWTPLGKTSFNEAATLDDGAALARTLDRALAQAFVIAKVARRSTGVTTLRLENHLPFTVANVTIKPTGSSGSVAIPYPGLGIGPARSVLAPIQAPAGVVERVELNGL